ncbi:MAG: ATP-binding cassette domain-containing protein [Gammaproteobacteria bacterium]
MNQAESPALVVSAVRCHGHGPYSLSLATGECVTLSGPSGSGKSLLLRAIADLEPHEGEVWLDGIESRSVSGPEWRKRVGYLAAESAWWGSRVADHFPGSRPEEWLVELGFDPDVWSARVTDLSTGERQRLALLRLLASHPQALLLDEPTASLDPVNTARVEQLVLAYCRQHNAPILWVSHNPAQVARIAGRHFAVTPGGLEPKKIAA